MCGKPVEHRPHLVAACLLLTVVCSAVECRIVRWAITQKANEEPATQLMPVEHWAQRDDKDGAPIAFDTKIT